jgi:hypothetical protein
LFAYDQAFVYFNVFILSSTPVMKENKIISPLAIIVSLLLAVSCNNNEPAKQQAEAPKKDSAAKEEPVQEVKRGPVINIGDTLSVKRLVLTVRDSAATIDRVSLKLREIYGSKLGALIRKNNLKVTGAPIAWYKGTKAPYFFEAGLPVDRKPARLPAGVHTRQIGTDSIVVAHFYGPYDLLPQAYDALKDWMKDHRKKPGAPPYEIYVGNPVDSTGKPIDPYKVQTDVVFSWK